MAAKSSPDITKYRGPRNRDIGPSPLKEPDRLKSNNDALLAVKDDQVLASTTNLALLHGRRLAKLRHPSWNGGYTLHLLSTTAVLPMKWLPSMAPENMATPPQSSPGSSAKLMSLIDMGKKQLVDQFYDTLINNLTDSTPLQAGHELMKKANNSALPLPSINKLLDGFDYDVVTDGSKSTEMTDYDFQRLVQNGGLKYHAASDRLENDDDLTDLLLNIDNLVAVWDTQEGGDTLEPLQEFMDLVTTAYASNAEKPFRQADFTSVELLQELDRLKAYLERLTKLTRDLLATLSADKDTIKLKYQQAIRDNVNRLAELQTHVEATESRLNQLRQRANHQKQLICSDLPLKMTVVEDIAAKVAASNEQTRAKRFRHFNVVMAVVVALAMVFVLGYYYYQ